MWRNRTVVPVVVAFTTILSQDGRAQKTGNEFSPPIPRTWDDASMATLELPLIPAVRPGISPPTITTSLRCGRFTRVTPFTLLVTSRLGILNG